MKYKNVAALLAAAMMALTLLAGCAKGGAENALDLTEVNAIVQENGCKTRVTASGALKRAVNETAEWAAAYDADEVTKDRIERHMTQKLDSWNKTVGFSGDGAYPRRNGRRHCAVHERHSETGRIRGGGRADDHQGRNGLLDRRGYLLFVKNCLQKTKQKRRPVQVGPPFFALAGRQGK